MTIDKQWGLKCINFQLQFYSAKIIPKHNIDVSSKLIPARSSPKMTPSFGPPTLITSPNQSISNDALTLTTKTKKNANAKQSFQKDSLPEKAQVTRSRIRKWRDKSLLSTDPVYWAPVSGCLKWATSHLSTNVTHMRYHPLPSKLRLSKRMHRAWNNATIAICRFPHEEPPQM